MNTVECSQVPNRFRSQIEVPTQAFQSNCIKVIKNERGSVLTFGILLALLLTTLSTVCIDVASLWTTKTTLNSVADAAALNAAGAVDVQNIYHTGSASSVRIDPIQARTRVLSYLRRSEVKNKVHNLRLLSVKVSQNKVQVIISCSPQLAFGYLLPNTTLSVKSRAVARNLTQ